MQSSDPFQKMVIHAVLRSGAPVAGIANPSCPAFGSGHNDAPLTLAAYLCEYLCILFSAPN
jgi:hypothetical protein